MTFPQPNSNAAVTTGQDVFRINTQVMSPGDIFESEVGCHAVAIGPNSDLDTVNVIYLDPVPKYFVPVAAVQPTLDTSMMGQATISPDRPYIGRLDAQVETADYPLINRPGRILFAAGDIVVDPSFYLPEAYEPTEDSLSFEPVYIDIIQYLTPPPSLIPQRSDKTYRYQYFPSALIKAGSAWVVIPGYGRKSGSFVFKNASTADPTDSVTVHVFGVKLSNSNTPGVVGEAAVEIFTSAALAVDDVANYVYDSSADGEWDVFYLVLEGYFGGSDPQPLPLAFPTTITLSDDPL